MQDFQRRIPRDQTGLALLAETVELLRDLDNVGRIGLESDLKRWRDEFLRDGPSHDWTQQVRAKLDNYRKNRDERLRQIENLPGKEDLDNVKKKVIPLVTDWAQTLADFRNAAPPVEGEAMPPDAHERIRDIDSRIQLARRSPDLTAEKAQAIVAEIHELLNALVSTARSRTRAGLLQLRTRLGLFCEACRTGAAQDERTAAVEGHIAELDGAALDDPVDLQDVARSLGTAKTELEDWPPTSGQSGRRGGGGYPPARTASRGCWDRPNPQQVAQGVHRNRTLIPQMAGEPQAQQSLALLEICDRVAADLARLDEQSAAALRGFGLRRERLLAHLAEIAGILEALEHEPEPGFEAVGPRLEALAEPAPGAALETYQAQLEAIEQTLAQALEQAMQEAAAALDRRRSSCADVAQALEAVQHAVPPKPDWPPTLEGLAPAAIQGLLVWSKQVEASFQAELRQAAAAVQQQTAAAAEGLRAYVGGVVQSNDSKRIWAEHLLGDFDDIERLGGADQTELVLASARWLAGSRTFQEELRRSETRARELREQVRALQLEIQKDSRHRYSRALFERARRLLEGVPEEPADWEQAVAQLTEAERTLMLADREAKRRIALELRDTARTLRAVLQGEPRAEMRRELELKLEKLESHAPDATPPHELRRDLLYQALKLGVQPSRR